MEPATATYSPDEIAERGKALYDRNLRELLQGTHFGQSLNTSAK